MSEPVLIKTTDLAHEVGVSRQTIAKWAREGLQEAAKVSHGKWDRERALSWIADRREDAGELDKRSDIAKAMAEARTELYKSQTKGSDIRNDLAMGVLCYRDRALDAFAKAASAQIATGDAWARDHKSPACAALADKGLSAAAILQLKAEVWNELRGLQSESLERVARDLAIGEDVAPSRVRVARRVG